MMVHIFRIQPQSVVRITGELCQELARKMYSHQTNIRLREFVFSCKVPNSVLKNTFIKGADIGFVGRNLFFMYKDINHVDPEASLGTGNNGQGIFRIICQQPEA